MKIVINNSPQVIVTLPMRNTAERIINDTGMPL